MTKTCKLLFLSLVLLSFTGLTACQNTVAGFGSDMQENGKKIETKAKSDTNN